jgi:FkbM family methyltransferase
MIGANALRKYNGAGANVALSANIISVASNPRMALAYARWLMVPVVKMPWGTRISGFRSFSEFWGFLNDMPSEDERRFVEHSLARGGVAFDVGANVGAFSTLMARYADQVHSFEPSPATYAALARNLRGIANVISRDINTWDALGVVDAIGDHNHRRESPFESIKFLGFDLRRGMKRSSTFHVRSFDKLYPRRFHNSTAPSKCRADIRRVRDI